MKSVWNLLRQRTKDRGGGARSLSDLIYTRDVFRTRKRIVTFFNSSRSRSQVLSLYEYGCSRRVGTVDVLVRLTSHGDLLATAFFRNPGSSKYKYVGVNEYVPTNASAGKNCCEQELPNKCCEYRTCRRRKTSEKREADAAQRGNNSLLILSVETYPTVVNGHRTTLCSMASI